MRNALSAFGKFFPVEANRLKISQTFRDRRHWVMIEKLKLDPLTDFIKRADGSVVRSKIDDPERRRRIRMMWDDGYQIEEIEEIEGELTDEEKRSLLK